MLSRREYQSIEATEVWHLKSKLPEADNSVANAPTPFMVSLLVAWKCRCSDEVAEYINAHQGGFVAALTR